jgi:small GTP-binding protein
MALPTLLDEEQSRIWEDEKQQIEKLLTLLKGWETDPADLDRLIQALNQLHELFLLVVVGEFNSGKSALINALLGKAFLAVGVTPTTEQIHIIKYGDPGPPEFQSDDIRVLRYPAELLREIHIVDTPGTNAVLRKHEAIARDFVPRSDMVIFVTSADRPFTESEHDFLDNIRQWGKKVVVVINKVDILESAKEVDEILNFVREHVRKLLDFQPEIFPLSARSALQRPDSVEGEGPGPVEGGFRSFQRFLLEMLTQEERIRIKLLSPLGVALKIARQYRSQADERMQVLRGDILAIEKVEHQLELYQEDTQGEFNRHLARIENELLEMRIRGEEFLDDRMRLWKIREMISGDRMRRAFESEVVAQTPENIEHQIQEVIDWLVERELRQWRLMAEELGRRQETDALRDAAREAASGFAYNRRQLLEGLGTQAEQVIANFDKKEEAARLAATVQESVAMVGLVEVGAISLGVLLKALLVGATADATGILAAGVLGVLGFAIIPIRRGIAKREMRKKMEDLRDRLNQVLEKSFGRELEQSTGRLREAVAPYRRFVLGEQARLSKTLEGLGAVEGKLLAIEATIEAEQEPSRG